MHNSIYSLNDISHASHFFINWFISTHEQVRDVGNRISARCKICGDSKKSSTKSRLNFYKQTNSIHCFNCGFSGSAIYYMSLVQHQPIHEIKKQIFQKYGIGLVPKKHAKPIINNQSPLFISENQLYKIKEIWNGLSDELPEEANEWIRFRKLELAQFKSENFQFRWETKRKYLAIPWIYNSEINYIQFRNIINDKRQKYLFLKDMTRPAFFNLDMVSKNIPYIFVCEAALDSIFIKNCVAGGTLNISCEQISLLHKQFPNHEICLMPDNIYSDEASRNSILNLIKKFPNSKFFMFPEKYKGFKDVNAIITNKKHNSTELKTAINEFSDIDFLLNSCITAATLKTKLILSYR